MPTDTEQVIARVERHIQSIEDPGEDDTMEPLPLDDLRTLLTLARQYRGGCATCGGPMNRDCLVCQKAWES